MSTVHYRNAVLLVNGSLLSASFNELAVSHSAEMLDATTFGYLTRINKGGLQVAEVSGRGLCEFGSGAVEDILFGLVDVDGTVIVVFPDGIVEGSPTGYAMLGVLNQFNIGGQVGTILPFDMAAQGRGVVP